MPRWTNWARTSHADADDLAAPADEAELCELVTRAASDGRKVKLPGSGHSWNGIAAPEGLWLRADRLPRTLVVAKDEVRVAGHVPLWQLCDALEANGRMLPNLGTITEQTVAGATATGTHGTGLRLPILSDGVLGMRFVDGTGQIVELHEDHADLADARVHLGALGIVTELRLRTVPARRLHERLVSVPFEAAMERLPDLVGAHRHVRLWWLPGAGVVQVYTADFTDDPDTGPNDLSVRLDRMGVQQPIFKVLLWFTRWFPALVPSLFRMSQKLSFPDRSRVEEARKVLTMPVPPRHDETELAVGIEHAQDALRAWWTLLERADYHPDFMQELRFVAGDEAALSPAFQRPSVYIGAYCTHPDTARRYFPEMWALGRDFSARPHWGKRFPHGHEELAALYPRMADFQALRQRYDPHGVYANTFTRRVFGG